VRADAEDTLWKGCYLGVWSRMMRNQSIKKQGNDVQGTSYLTRNTPDKISP
jgi:Na+-transporting NADH:ubiquinone oxidoreductase subunit NqrC